ncbi:MAG: flagellar hook-associated protein FlgL [Ignavibacteria bacterium]
MRISTSMIYDTGIRSITDQTASLLHTQQALATGRRVVTPADDPVAAARALVVTEAKDVNAQFATNQGNAKDALNLEESQMSSLNDLLTRIRQLAVQGGDGALAANDLKSISAELRSRFDELLGLANTTDSNGDFIFAGTMGATKPFGANVDGLLAAPGNEVTYSGDSSQRSLQVSATRYLEVSDSGADIFRQIRNGNGSFVTDYATTNTGTAVIDAGSVTNTATWNALADKNYSLQFWTDTNGVAGTPGQVYYDIIDTTAGSANQGNSMITGAPAVNPPTLATDFQAMRKFYEAQTIPLSTQPGDTGPAFDLGSTVNITGTPGNSDTFTIAPSTSQSLFKTVANLIGALENKLSNATTSGSTALANEIAQALTNLDQATDNVLRVRAQIGSRLNELDTLSSVNQDVDLRYKETLSGLQDVDYAKSISDLQQNQTSLDAAQKSYMKVTQLSLFSYL